MAVGSEWAEGILAASDRAVAVEKKARAEAVALFAHAEGEAAVVPAAVGLRARGAGLRAGLARRLWKKSEKINRGGPTPPSAKTPQQAEERAPIRATELVSRAHGRDVDQL